MEQRIGRYQVLEEIASGGQATVYRVWDTDTGRILALKVMHPHMSQDAAYLERFHREARLASSINHPNVVRIYEVGQEGDKHYMALEYFPLTLHHLIQAQTKMPVERVVDIAHQVALGLEAAREQGIIHRDIKPQNILIGPEGTTKVPDFGISRAADLSTMTRTGMIMGTPYYMSPEQAMGLRVDIRSDVYSLGVVMYQMLTGELPLEADTPWEVIRRHIEVKPRPVRQLRSDTPRPVEQVVTRCLEKEPGKRYVTPLGLAQALELALPRAVTPPPAEAPPRPLTPTPPPPPPRPVTPARPPQPSTFMRAWESALRAQRRGPLWARFVGLAAVSNQQKWDTLGAERSGAGWRSGEFPEGPVVASSPFGGLSLHLLPAL